MKKKMLIALAALCVLLCIVIIGVRVSLNNEAEGQSKGETSIAVDGSTAPLEETTEESNSNSAAIIESTPDSITIEISNEEGNESSKTILGGESGDGSGEDFDENPAPPTDSQSQASPEKQPDEDRSEAQPGKPITGDANSAMGPDMDMTYEEYEAMSSEEKMLFYYSFADADSFFEWYNAAKAAYESENGSIIIGEDGTVDLGK